MANKEAQARREPTLLQQIMGDRHLTREATVKLLRERSRAMNVDKFGLDVRQLDRWLAGDYKIGPRASQCAVLEAVFGYSVEELLGPADLADLGDRRQGTQRGRRLMKCEDFVGWLAVHSGEAVDHVYSLVADGADDLAALTPSTRAGYDHARSVLARSVIADAVHAFYGRTSTGFYRARIGDGTEVALSVLSDPDWIGLDIPLDTEHELARVITPEDATTAPIPPAVFRAAVKRLAVVEEGDATLYDRPLFRLIGVNVEKGRLAATFAVASFAAYALTVDLMETELLESLVAEHEKSTFPVRARYLPSIAAATAYEHRLCAGGVVCLFAIARDDDYWLIVQERSSRVLNAVGRLSVVPKAFHQPLTDTRDCALSSTINRELEEELLGREELDQMSPESRSRVVPGHLSAMSAPMRWLHDHPGSYLLGCTAFGINMLSGNYEFACLAIIDDPSWWSAHAGSLQSNWEVHQTHGYSSLDAEGLAKVVADPRWSNEGLFAFLEGLRSLARHDPGKVRLPKIEVIP